MGATWPEQHRVSGFQFLKLCCKEKNEGVREWKKFTHCDGNTRKGRLTRASSRGNHVGPERYPNLLGVKHDRRLDKSEVKGCGLTMVRTLETV